MKICLFKNESFNQQILKFFSNHQDIFIESLTNLKDSDLDENIHQKLVFLSQKPIDIFVLPISLTDNFLDFSGLRLAYHIRLSENIPFQKALIVFFSGIDFDILQKITPFASIINTPNVQFVDLKKYTFYKIFEAINKNKLSNFDNAKFFQHLIIIPPENYDTHHNVDNEFALYRWAESCGLLDALPSQTQAHFQSHLYFKYLKIKNSWNNSQSRYTTLWKINQSTKILLIDDDWEKGWKNFYQSWFKLSYHIQFQCIENNFDIEMILKTIQNFEPDIVLLDLRLIDTDTENQKDLSGIEILKKIKQWNWGIQVIITTASNKKWNYEKANQNGADGYIIKEGNGEVVNILENLQNTIEKCAQRAFFLKKIKNFYDKIYENLNSNSLLQDDKDFLANLNHKLNIACELLIQGVQNPEKFHYYHYAFLELFQCVESFLILQDIYDYKKNIVFNQYKVVEKKSDDIYYSMLTYNEASKNQNSSPSYFSYGYCESEQINPKNTDFKMSAVLIFLFGIEYPHEIFQNWLEIRRYRNNAIAHAKKVNHNFQDSADEFKVQEKIEKLLEFLIYIFNADNYLGTTKADLSNHPMIQKEITIITYIQKNTIHMLNPQKEIRKSTYTGNELKIGDIVETQLTHFENCNILKKIEDPDYTIFQNLIQDFEDHLKLNMKGYGFIGSVYVSSEFIQKHQLKKNQKVKVRAIQSYDETKKKWVWTAIDKLE